MLEMFFFASSVVILFLNPEIRGRARKFIGTASDKIFQCLEIFKQSSLTTVKDFCMLKLRTKISNSLETGLLIKPSKYHFYDLIYYDDLNRYIVRFPKVRGPSNISQILTNDVIDVTNKVKEYMGPSHNFHGIPTTPDMLGFDSLTFVMIDGATIKFEQNEEITSVS